MAMPKALTRRLLILSLGLLLSGVVLYLLMRIYAASVAVPSFASIQQANASSYTAILDRQGQPLERIRQNFQERRVDWFELEQFSPELVQAVLDSEDRRYYSHWGVDWLALLQATKDHLLDQSQRGASTITMQLVGLLPEHKRQGHRAYWQKLQQILYAQSLEMAWSKEQILEAYLNLVPLRGETIGVPSASRTYFHKFPSGLHQQEAVILAAMLRAPNASAERIAERACALLHYRQQLSQAVDQQSAQQSCQLILRLVNNALANPQASMLADISLAPHFARRYLTQRGSYQAGEAYRTSLDQALQQFVVQRVQQRLQELFANQVQDAAVVVLDKRSGEILAYVGSSGQLTRAQHVDHAQALRQAGSTLKPFLYAQALDEQRLTAASLVNDALLNLSEQTGLYVPQNYDRSFRGWVSVRTALASSLNIPAVRVMTMLGEESFWRVLRRLGLPLHQEPDFYGYSLALGSADIDLLSLTNAYRALANQGLYSPVRWQVSSQEGAVSQEDQRVFSQAASWIIGDILSDRHARAITFGLDSALSTPFWSAVKTGTSKDMRDNWTVGWSSHYTVGVWVGNSSGASMRDITGVSGAGPIWHDVMQYLHRSLPSHAPAMVPGVRAQTIHFQDHLEPDRLEYFLAGTEMKQIRLAQRLQAQSRWFIESPADQMIIALDPDIPLDKQKVLLQAQQLGGDKDQSLTWRVNGVEMSHENPYPLAILPGRYRIELLQSSAQVVDSVSIQVRGARLKTAP